MKPDCMYPIILTASFTLLAVGPAVGQESFSDSAGFHIVRPGDTLEGIAEKYLGSSRRWPEIWPLNKSEVPDPHRIYPRQRLVIPFDGNLPDGAATLTKASRRVEGQMQPHPWETAIERDLLQQRDGLRTFESSSAQVDFDDGSLLVLTEQSLVFIGEAARDSRAAADRSAGGSTKSIEIVTGQGDLSGALPSAGEDGIEITIGGARTVPSAGQDGSFSTRARRHESGSAQIMTYAGASTVSSAGVDVVLEKGTGSAVAAGKPPSPPERLLPAPATLSPGSGAELYSATPSLTWQAVPSAVSYTVEVCADPNCGKLVARKTGLDQPSWTPAELPVASLHWRVNAVSASGLDGFVSPSVAFAVLGAYTDREPPTIGFRVVGPHLGSRFGLNPSPVVGPTASSELDLDDPGSGGANFDMTLDGSPIVARDLLGPWTAGEHELGVVAVDRAGNRRGPELLNFVFDPDPPTFEWGVEGTPAVGILRAGESSVIDTQRARRIGPTTWQPFGRGRKHKRLQVTSDNAQVIIRPNRKSLDFPWMGMPVRPDQAAWIHAVDELCGEVKLRYDIVSRDDGTSALRVDAEDCVGNTILHDFYLANRTFTESIN